MARSPEVFVRPLSMPEGQRLQRISRTAKDPVRLRRAMVVLASAQGWPVPDIADLAQVSQRYVRGVIHDFNERGFADPKWSGGAPRRIDNRTRAKIRVIASCRPRDLGQPFSTWSLAKLRDCLIATGAVSSISRETIRVILAEAGIAWQATKTWKGSSDPDFAAKMRRVLDLTTARPADGRGVCRRVRAAEPATTARTGVAACRQAGPAARHLHPHSGCPAHDRGARPVDREDPLPDPGPENGGGRSSPSSRPCGAGGRMNASTSCWTTFSSQAPASHRLVRGQRGRAGVPAHQRLLVELDRATRSRLGAAALTEGGSI